MSKDQIKARTEISVDPNAIRSRIIPVFVNKGRNVGPEMAKTTFLDMAVIFKFYIGHDDKNNGVMTMAVTNEMLDIYGIDAEGMFKESMSNASRMIPPEIINMKEALGGDTPDADNDPLYVVSNRILHFGAPGIFQPMEAANFCKKHHSEGIYILPSSIHETMIITKEDADRIYIDVDGLKEIVRSTNDDTVLAVTPEAYLSDSVYYFNAISGFSIL
jgi:hypothetical protein